MRTIYSFGYKMNGQDQFAVTGHSAPLVLDCRALRNPHNIPGLRRLTGRDKAVQECVAESARAQKLLHEAVLYLDANPNGTVAFGCAYGKHRSVALAEILGDLFPGSKVIHTGAARKYVG